MDTPLARCSNISIKRISHNEPIPMPTVDLATTCNRFNAQHDADIRFIRMLYLSFD